tara:strand:+ start:341 stop:628 length:288 start_codon:yes stop_codon:yes gene_type:complete
MKKINKTNLTKKEIAQKINNKIGISQVYTNEILDDFILLLKNLIRKEGIQIQNFGTFKIINKRQRKGRNPKNKEKFTISARKTLSFIMSKNLLIK